MIACRVEDERLTYLRALTGACALAPIAIACAATGAHAQQRPLKERICENRIEQEELASNYSEADDNTIVVVENTRVTNPLGMIVLVNCLPDARVEWVEAAPDTRENAGAGRLAHEIVHYPDDANDYRLLDFNRVDPRRRREASDIRWHVDRNPDLPQTCNFRVWVRLVYDDGREATVNRFVNPCRTRYLTLLRPDAAA